MDINDQICFTFSEIKGGGFVPLIPLPVSYYYSQIL